MIIDLNKDERLGYVETIYELTKAKSNKLIKEILVQKNRTGQNFMIVPMSIYNILESNTSFKFAKLESLFSQKNLRHMGSIHEIEIYLDLFSPSDIITLKHDIRIIRDNKIDSILNNVKLKDEIEITVLNY